MIVFRLSKSKYAEDLSGKGAEIAGGRWNSKGKKVLYTSQSIALCTTEIAVHTPLGNIPTDYNLTTIEIPDVPINEYLSGKLPKDWKSFPHSKSSQKIGDLFLTEGKFLVLKVPSAVVQGEFNYLLNPEHEFFHKIKILRVEEFSFDKRLFKG
jgi:RES domain-containing protein